MSHTSMPTSMPRLSCEASSMPIVNMTFVRHNISGDVILAYLFKYNSKRSKSMYEGMDEEAREIFIQRTSVEMYNEFLEAKMIPRDSLLPVKDSDEAYISLSQMGVRFGSYVNGVLRECILPSGMTIFPSKSDIRRGTIEFHGDTIATWSYRNRDMLHSGEVQMI